MIFNILYFLIGFIISLLFNYFVVFKNIISILRIQKENILIDIEKFKADVSDDSFSDDV